LTVEGISFIRQLIVYGLKLDIFPTSKTVPSFIFIVRSKIFHNKKEGFTPPFKKLENSTEKPIAL